MMNETDIAWLAGIIDGEGCFSVKNPVRRDARGRTCYQVWLVLCNTSKAMVERSVAIIAGLGCKAPTIRRVWKGKEATRYQYWMNIGAKHDVLKVTEALLPHLTAKKIEAEVVAWYMRRACAVAAYKQTDLDVAVLRSLTKVKKHGGEAPAEVVDLLREVIPNEALLSSAVAADDGSERVETTQLSLNDNAAHECPTPHRCN